MSNGGTVDKNIELLKNEYDLARHEYEYYTDLFNKQDNLYSVYFAIFAIIIGTINYIFEVTDENSIINNIILLYDKKLLVCGLIIFLAVTYMYLFVIMLGNSYYLIIYSEKIIILEKVLNCFITKNIFIWETDFMAKIQSKDNCFTKGYLNVNLIKMIFAIILYLVVEIPLCLLWYLIVGYTWLFYLYIFILISISLFLMYDWIIMWWRLPKHYREELRKLYNNKLNIHITN